MCTNTKAMLQNDCSRFNIIASLALNQRIAYLKASLLYPYQYEGSGHYNARKCGIFDEAALYSSGQPFYLVRHGYIDRQACLSQACFLSIITGGTKDWIWEPLHAKELFYHWTGPSTTHKQSPGSWGHTACGTWCKKKRHHSCHIELAWYSG